MVSIKNLKLKIMKIIHLKKKKKKMLFKYYNQQKGIEQEIEQLPQEPTKNFKYQMCNTNH
jgi:hypothetical protein